MMVRPAGRRRRRVAFGLLAALSSLALLTVPTTEGTLLGRVTNNTNTAASAIYGNTTSCTTVASTAAYGNYFVYPFDETGTTITANDRGGNGRNGTYSGTGASSYTLGAAGPCPRDNGRAVTLDGSTGYVNGVTQTNPQTFSVQIWFRTAAANQTGGGRLIGFGNGTGRTTSSQYDRHLYMTNNGRIVFGVYPGGVKEVISTASYNDGQWHHAVGTLGASGTNAGLRLYVDGTQVGADTTVTSAEAYNGSWRMGFDNLSGWGNTPTKQYFAGSLAYAAVFTTILTPTQVAALNAAGR